jgi:hypothetical protein
MQQAMSEWCWAASISMLFSFYQHPVSQPRIVEDAYGGIANLPAMQGATIASKLNKTWTDDNGVVFHAQLTGAYDATAGILALSDQMIVRELDQNHPLIIGARTHAMVLTAVQYYVTPYGPSIAGAGVFDPWPGIGTRALQPDELVRADLGGSLIFLATARVLDGAGPPPPPPPPPVCSIADGHRLSVRTLLTALTMTAVVLVVRRRRRGR